MSDDEKWSRDGGKKEEDINDIPEAEATPIPEAIPIPEVPPIPSTPSRHTPPSTTKKSGSSWTISVDEAVDYGFKSIKGVLPYLIGVLICYIVSFVSFNTAQTVSVLGSINNADTVKDLFLGFGYIFFVVGLLIQLALTIGLGYKFGGDLLLRAVRFHHSIERKK